MKFQNVLIDVNILYKRKASMDENKVKEEVHDAYFEWLCIHAYRNREQMKEKKTYFNLVKIPVIQAERI